MFNPRRSMIATAMTAAAMIATTAISTTASADSPPPTLCVPAIEDDHAQWWNPEVDVETVEAEFNAGAGLGVADGTRSAVTRMLWDPGEELLMVRVAMTGDESVEPADDRFVLVVSDEDGEIPELFIEFRPLLGCGDPEECEAGRGVSDDAIQYAEATVVTSLSWSPLSDVNPSTDFEIYKPWIEVEIDDSGPITLYHWTLSFALQVPVDGNGDIRPDLHVYGTVLDYVPGPTSDTIVELPTLCESSSPTSNDCLIEGGTHPTDYPDGFPYYTVEQSWPLVRSDCFELELGAP